MNDQPPAIRWDVPNSVTGNTILQTSASRAHTIQFYGSDNTPWLTIDLDANPPTIDLHGHTPDEAAKVFWNRAAELVQQPPLFPNKP